LDIERNLSLCYWSSENNLKIVTLQYIVIFFFPRGYILMLTVIV